MPFLHASHLPHEVMQEMRTEQSLRTAAALADYGYLLDDADPLVPENSADFDGGHVAFENVEISAADRGFGDADDGVRRRLKFGLGLVLPGTLAGAVVDECLHACLLNSVGDVVDVKCAHSVAFVVPFSATRTS